MRICRIRRGSDGACSWWEGLQVLNQKFVRGARSTPRAAPTPSSSVERSPTLLHLAMAPESPSCLADAPRLIQG